MPSSPLSTSARKNIEAIAQIEQALHGRRSRVEKIGDGVARFFGSLSFIAAHALFFAVWVGLNARTLSLVPAFDPYPFPFLGFIVGIEFIFLTTFVLMNQHLQSKRQEHWGHLTLQVCLLTEQEGRRNMRMLHTLCEHLRLNQSTPDQEINDMTRTIQVADLIEEMERARELGESQFDESDPHARQP